MKHRIYPAIACVTAILCLGGCSSISACLKPQPYMQARQLPPLESPPGLDVPPPDPDMKIPDVDSGPVGQYKQPIPGRPESVLAHCLIAPPPMPEPG